eukprot:1333420-Pyramimonas_sp.AAC.1
MPDLDSRNYSYSSSYLEMCCRFLTRAGYIAGSHRNRLSEIRRVRLSNGELEPRSALRTRSAKPFVFFELFWEESIQRHHARPPVALNS